MASKKGSKEVVKLENKETGSFIQLQKTQSQKIQLAK